MMRDNYEFFAIELICRACDTEAEIFADDMMDWIVRCPECKVEELYT